MKRSINSTNHAGIMVPPPRVKSHTFVGRAGMESSTSAAFGSMHGFTSGRRSIFPGTQLVIPK